MAGHSARASSTIDLFDRDFVLLTTQLGDRWREAATTASRALGVPVTSSVIDNPEWPHSYGVTATGAVLVRPDGHVAWRSSSLPGAGTPTPLDQIHAALATCTGAAA